MATFKKVREAVIDRLGDPFPDFTGYTHLPDLIECPAFYVEADRPLVTYEETFGPSPMALWHLCLTVLVDKIDEEEAQDLLEPILDPEGPFVTALHSTQYRDALWEITNGTNNVNVMDADNYGYLWDKQRQTQYYGVQIHLCVKTA